MCSDLWVWRLQRSRPMSNKALIHWQHRRLGLKPVHSILHRHRLSAREREEESLYQRQYEEWMTGQGPRPEPPRRSPAVELVPAAAPKPESKPEPMTEEDIRRIVREEVRRCNYLGPH